MFVSFNISGGYVYEECVSWAKQSTGYYSRCSSGFFLQFSFIWIIEWLPRRSTVRKIVFNYSHACKATMNWIESIPCQRKCLAQEIHILSRTQISSITFHFIRRKLINGKKTAAVYLAGCSTYKTILNLNWHRLSHIKQTEQLNESQALKRLK